MSTVVIATQIRGTIQLSDGSIRYLVSTSVKDQGDLPFAEIFVVQITDPQDPKRDVLVRIATPQEFRQTDETAPRYVKASAPADIITLGPDTFVRVGNINDLTALSRDRVVAVRQQQTTYLASQVTALYDNVQTALAAAQTFRARASDLVVAWRAAQTSFLTNPSQDYVLPILDGSVETQLTDDYKSKKAARIAAEAARDAAQLAKDACERDCTADKAIYDFLVADVAFLQVARQSVTALTETGSTNVQTYVLNGADPTSYEALLNKKRLDLATYAAKVRACSVNCANLGAQLLAAQRTVDNARAAETTSLATLTAVCPTFNPSSV